MPPPSCFPRVMRGGVTLPPAGAGPGGLGWAKTVSARRSYPILLPLYDVMKQRKSQTPDDQRLATQGYDRSEVAEPFWMLDVRAALARIEVARVAAARSQPLAGEEETRG